jgi:hypothetical protein
LNGAGLRFLGSEPAALVTVSLGFLGVSPFATKAKLLSYWIRLDSLGISRPNPDFSMGYDG